MSIIARFSPAWGSLVVLGDTLDNTIQLSLGASGNILLNDGSLAVTGGAPTVTNTRYIQVLGQAGNDVLTVDESNGALPLLMMIGGDGNDLMAAGSGNDTLRGDAGDDTLDGGGGTDLLLGGLGNDLLLGGAGADHLLGGDGADIALMGAGDDTFAWNPGDDSDIVEGQDGFDTVQFKGSSASENILLAANGARVALLRDLASVTMDLNDTERVMLATLGGADTVVVGDLSGTDLLEVVVDLAAAGGAGDGQADRVFIDGTPGDDVVIIAVDGSELMLLGLAATVRLLGFEPGIDTLIVRTLGGDDVVEASAVSAPFPVWLEGGDGSDVLIGGSGNDTLIGGAGDDVLIGGPGIDLLIGLPGDDILIQ